MSIQIQLTDGNTDLYGIGNNIFIERDKSTGLWRAMALRGGWIQAVSGWQPDPRNLLDEIKEVKSK